MSDWAADLRSRDERIARRIAELRNAQAAWIAARQAGFEMARLIMAEMNAHGC